MAGSLLSSFKTNKINDIGNEIKKTDTKIELIYYMDIKGSENNRELRKIKELAEDIEEAGLDHNIVIRPIIDEKYKYEIVAGHRRTAAINYNIKKGDKTYEYIPAKIIDICDIDTRERLILNNFETDPLTQFETLEAVEELKKIYKEKKENGEKIPGRIQEIIASHIGLKKSQVGNYEKVAKNAVPEIRQMIEDGDLSINAAAELVTLEDEEQLMFIDSGSDMNIKSVKEYVESLKTEDDVYMEDDENYEEQEPEVKESNIKKSEINNDLNNLRSIKGFHSNMDWYYNQMKKKVDILDDDEVTLKFDTLIGALSLFDELIDRKIDAEN